VHLEACSLLLAGFGTQVTQTQPHEAGSQPLVSAVLRCEGALAASSVAALLQLVASRPAPPTHAQLYGYRHAGGLLRAASGALLGPVSAAAAAAARLLPRVRAAPSAGLAPPPALSASPLGDSALLLLLLLLHAPSAPSAASPFAAALRDCGDAATRPGDGGEADPERGGGGGGGGAAPFDALFQALCRGIAARSDAHVLLLYASLVGGSGLGDAVLGRGDPETLLLPLLAVLSAGGGGRDAQYVALSSLLLLSQEPAWHNALHAARLTSPPDWLGGRPGAPLSAGSLLVLVLTRCVTRALGERGGGDVYLHTSCLAALANAAPHVAGLAPQPAQRLLSLLLALARRAEVEAARGCEQQAALFADLARLLLEALNGMLTYAAQRNPELLYALLQRQEALQALARLPALAELARNLLAVADWFGTRLEADRLQAVAAARAWSAGAALERVRAHAVEWRGDGLRVFEPLRFTYEEEDTPEDFFVPHTWALVVAARLPCAWHAPSLVLLELLEEEHKVGRAGC